MVDGAPRHHGCCRSSTVHVARTEIGHGLRWHVARRGDGCGCRPALRHSIWPHDLDRMLRWHFGACIGCPAHLGWLVVLQRISRMASRAHRDVFAGGQCHGGSARSRRARDGSKCSGSFLCTTDRQAWRRIVWCSRPLGIQVGPRHHRFVCGPRSLARAAAFSNDATVERCHCRPDHQSHGWSVG